jgi:hypothetical protein
LGWIASSSFLEQELNTQKNKEKTTMGYRIRMILKRFEMNHKYTKKSGKKRYKQVNNIQQKSRAKNPGFPI